MLGNAENKLYKIQKFRSLGNLGMYAICDSDE